MTLTAACSGDVVQRLCLDFNISDTWALKFFNSFSGTNNDIVHCNGNVVLLAPDAAQHVIMVAAHTFTSPNGTMLQQFKPYQEAKMIHIDVQSNQQARHYRHV